MQSGPVIQGVIYHSTPILTRPVYHIRQHITKDLGNSSISDPRKHNDTKYGSTPELSAPVLRCRGYLATTSIEAISNILRPDILRNLNDTDVLKNSLGLNSSE